ncbi:MAG: nucleotidyltransferase domain-containing protein [Oscillospiraceae bacterium]|nr:nucleotidyltransferase domain-containing protein [Oscillospiraceae bacterium]
MVYSIAEIKKIVLPIVQKYHIPALYLFGSYARGEATEESDLDFLVDTTGTNITSLIGLGSLYCDLSEAFGKRIDLVTVRAFMCDSNWESDRNFKEAIMKERVKLYDVA